MKSVLIAFAALTSLFDGPERSRAERIPRR
jgi:hypothetical protein